MENDVVSHTSNHIISQDESERALNGFRDATRAIMSVRLSKIPVGRLDNPVSIKLREFAQKQVRPCQPR